MPRCRKVLSSFSVFQPSSIDTLCSAFVRRGAASANKIRNRFSSRRSMLKGNRSLRPPAGLVVEVTALTGITDEDVAGHKFDDAAVTSFVDDSVIVIAHNSSSDRRFAERYWPVFEHKAWGCSMSEIDWRKHGLPARGSAAAWRGLLPPSAPGTRRLSLPAGGARFRTADDGLASTGAPARDRPQAGDADGRSRARSSWRIR